MWSDFSRNRPAAYFKTSSSLWVSAAKCSFNFFPPSPISIYFMQVKKKTWQIQMLVVLQTDRTRDPRVIARVHLHTTPGSTLGLMHSSIETIFLLIYD